MNNPLETNSFKHYLRFTSLGLTDLYRISEPQGFTDAKFEKKQKSKAYARDEQICAIDKLTFPNTSGEFNGVLQQINPQGDSSEYLDYGFAWMQSIYKEFGFESKVDYVITKDDLEFSVGVLDFTDKDLTDGYNYISCKLIQNNKVQDYKRQDDTKFNAFSVKNFKDEDITPAPTFNYLRKSTPTRNISNWKQTTELLKVAVGVVDPFNPALQIETYGINNSLVPFYPTANTFNHAVENFVYIKAKNDLTDIKLLLDANIDFHYQQSGGNAGSVARMELWYAIWTGDTFSLSQQYGILYQKALTETSTQDYTLNEVLEINVNDVQRDYKLSLFWQIRYSSEHLSLTKWNFKKTNFEISATETAIDIVTKACLYIDLIKQSSKFINNIPVNAPLFDVGGVHYNQAVFNRRMVSQNTDYFYATSKSVLGSVEEVNCDYEINENEIFIGRQNDFYKNVEIAVLPIIPSEEYTESFNDRFMCNSFRYGYKTYEQDRTTKGTSQAIHTESEWIIPNLMVENKKEISNEFVRDSLSIQSIINLEIKEPTTSTDNDDDIYIEEIVNIPPGLKGGFGARLLMRIVAGQLQILNRDSEGDSGDVVINWQILGFNVGNIFTIVSGENSGSYTVVAPISNSLLILQPIGFTPTFQGDAYINVEYPYTNIQYQTRTNEGFIIPSSPILSNINYSIKRNMKYWGTFINSCMLYSKTKLRNSYFKSNGAFKSQLVSESEPLTENADVLYSELDDPLVTPFLIRLSLSADFTDILNMFEQYRLNRGFVRCYDLNGKVLKLFIQNLEHTFSTNELEITGEQKYDTEYLYLTFANETLTVNDVPYSLQGISDWWIFNNDYFKAYDKNNIPICNFYKYNFVFLNGIKYDTKAELLTALTQL